jgi:hypothetical protein
VAPVGPDGPAGPVAPCGPVAPVAPAAPAGPVAPLGPSKFVVTPTHTPFDAMTSVVPTFSPFLIEKLELVAIDFYICYLILSFLNICKCIIRR